MPPPLSRDRWRTLSPYIDEALGMSRERRAGWLEAIRTIDAALAADLERLLADLEDLQDSRFLERSFRWPGVSSARNS